MEFDSPFKFGNSFMNVETNYRGGTQNKWTDKDFEKWVSLTNFVKFTLSMYFLWSILILVDFCVVTVNLG